MKPGAKWTRWPTEAASDAVALRQQGVSYRAIAITITHFHGLEVTPHAVRYLCRTGGCPPVGAGRRGANFRKQAA